MVIKVLVMLTGNTKAAVLAKLLLFFIQSINFLCLILLTLKILHKCRLTLPEQNNYDTYNYSGKGDKIHVIYLH